MFVFTGWFGFWIFLAVFIVCDHWIFSLGYDSFFQEHKTAAEKELQQLKIQERKYPMREVSCETKPTSKKGEP